MNMKFHYDLDCQQWRSAMWLCRNYNRVTFLNYNLCFLRTYTANVEGEIFHAGGKNAVRNPVKAKT